MKELNIALLKPVLISSCLKNDEKFKRDGQLGSKSVPVGCALKLPHFQLNRKLNISIYDEHTNEVNVLLHTFWYTNIQVRLFNKSLISLKTISLILVFRFIL